MDDEMLNQVWSYVYVIDAMCERDDITQKPKTKKAKRRKDFL